MEEIYHKELRCLEKENHLVAACVKPTGGKKGKRLAKSELGAFIAYIPVGGNTVV